MKLNSLVNNAGEASAHEKQRCVVTLSRASHQDLPRIPIVPQHSVSHFTQRNVRRRVAGVICSNLHTDRHHPVSPEYR